MSLDKLVGLSTSECCCLPSTGGATFNINESESGIYIDDGLSLKGLDNADCGDPNNIWQNLNRSLQMALTQVKTDLNVAVNKANKPKEEFYGKLGQAKSKDPVVTSETDKGVKIESRMIEGSYLKLNMVQTKFTTTETSTLRIYNDVDSDPLFTIEIESEAARWKATQMTEDIILPLYNNEQELNYYFLHDKEGYSNEADCGCGKKSWSEFIKFTGVRTSDLSIGGRDSAACYNNMHGLILEVEIGCDFDLCNLNKTDKQNLAQAINYKSKVNFIENSLKKGNINATTLITREQLIQDIQDYSIKYFEQIEYLAKVIPLGGCYSCNYGSRKATILL